MPKLWADKITEFRSAMQNLAREHMELAHSVSSFLIFCHSVSLVSWLHTSLSSPFLDVQMVATWTLPGPQPEEVE